MCGIAGVFRRDGTPPDPSVIRRMTDAIAHRGPDGEGMYTDRGYAGGIRRLAIIDLVSGDQPMSTPSGSGHLVFNGELYNYRELRDELASTGSAFRTTSDTEVVAVALERWGREALQRFVGMYAFAFWRSDEQRLLLVRDRLGIKPLYVLDVAGQVAFASEIKCFTASGLLRAEPDPASIDTFLAYGHSMAPRTVFRGVRKLLPGELVELTSRTEEGESYWRPPLPSASVPSWTEAVAGVRERLDEAVRSHMVSDVPVGALLSGGLDSSAVVALMAAHSTQVRTYTVGFEGDDEAASDLAAARLVADRFSTDHHELIVTAADFEAAIDTLVYHYDEPFADAAGVPTYLISKLARRDVKVLLTGEGGDELFAGYRRYVADGLISRFSSAPMPARKVIAALLGLTGPRRKRIGRALVARTRTARFASWFEAIPLDVRRALYTPAFAARLEGSTLDRFNDLFGEAGDGHGAAASLWVELRTRLSDAYLEKVDKATMAMSIEARVPLLDHRLVEYAARLPLSYKLRGGTTKAVFRAAVAPLLPTEVIERAKRGFDPPLGRWLSAPLRARMREILLDRRTIQRGYFREGVYRLYVERALAGDGDLAGGVWSLLNLELWHRTYVDAPAAVAR